MITIVNSYQHFTGTNISTNHHINTSLIYNTKTEICTCTLVFTLLGGIGSSGPQWSMSRSTLFKTPKLLTFSSPPETDLSFEKAEGGSQWEGTVVNKREKATRLCCHISRIWLWSVMFNLTALQFCWKAIWISDTLHRGKERWLDNVQWARARARSFKFYDPGLASINRAKHFTFTRPIFLSGAPG